MKKIGLRRFAVLIILFCFSCSKEKVPTNNAKSSDTTKTGTKSTNISGSFVSKFARFTEGQQYAGTISSLWSDTAWLGDRIHNQAILWSGTKSFSNITYLVSNLVNGSNSIAASAMRLRFENYITGDQVAETCGDQISRSPVLIADALSSTPITTLTASDPVKIWVTSDIPSTAVPGTYTGSITIASNGVTQQIFYIKLLVVNKTLPSASNWQYHLDLWQFPFQLLSLYNAQHAATPITAFSSQHFALIAPFYKMLADAGQSAITTYIKDGAVLPGQTMVNWTKNTDGTWSYDYTNFDKYVDTLMSWGIKKQIDCFSLAGWENSIGYYDAASGTSKVLNDTIGTSTYNSIWSGFLTDFKNHLQSKGWFNKAVLYMDEIPDESMKSINSLIKSNSSSWQIGLAGSYQSSQDEAALYDYSNILGSPRVNNPPINTISSFYTSCSQAIPNDYLTPQNSPAEIPWMSWYAAANGLNGYLRWAYDYWTLSDPTNIEDGSNTAGDYSFVYRASNNYPSQAISSIRFELLREGIQDYEKIKILNSNAVTLKNSLNQFTATSGSNAASLVAQGEHVLKSIAAGG